MKIKLAILDSDQNYIERMTSAFTGKYSDKLELYSFSNMAGAMETIAAGRIDVFIANESYDIDVKALPKRIGFAYFVDSMQQETCRGQRTVCKYQKVDLIYKEVLSIFAENNRYAIGLGLRGEGGSKYIAFVSASGGVGSSTMAAAFSVYLAKRGHKVLYLNTEDFGSAESFFSGPGQSDFGDVIYAIKSKKSNLALKLESAVRQDVSGVCYYAPSKVALDLREMDIDDYKQLLEDLAIAGYAYIVLDTDFTLSRECVQLLKAMDNVAFVSDGSAMSNQKFERAFHALSLLEKQEDFALSNRVALIYNKFSSKTGKAVENSYVQVLGGAPKYEQATSSQVLAKLQELSIFEKLL